MALQIFGGGSGGAGGTDAGALQKSANLSDVAAAATARTNLGLGTAATKNTGTAAGAVPVLAAGGKIPAAAIPSTASPIEGQQALIYGHSYSAGTGASNNFGYAQRLARRLNLGTVFNRAVASTTSHREAVLEPVADFNNFIKSGGAFTAFSDSVINDVADAENGTYGGGLTAPLQAPAVAKITNMKKFLIAASRRNGSAITDSSGSYTGTWTTNATDAEAIIWTTGAAGSSHSTTTQNDSVVFSGLTAGAKVVVILQGIDNGKAPTAGASFSIAATGMTTITGTTGNQFFQGRDTMSRGPMPVVVQLPAGVTALTITKTDATGTILYVNAVLHTVGAGVAPWFFFLKAPYVNTLADASVDRLNAGIDAAVAAFADDGLVVIDPNLNGWSKSTMLVPDGLHPNDRGHAFLADLYATTALALPYGVTTNGVGRNTTTS